MRNFILGNKSFAYIAILISALAWGEESPVRNIHGEPLGNSYSATDDTTTGEFYNNAQPPESSEAPSANNNNSSPESLEAPNSNNNNPQFNNAPLPESPEDREYKGAIIKISNAITETIAQIQAKQKEIDGEVYLAYKPPLEAEKADLERQLRALEMQRDLLQSQKTSRELSKQLNNSNQGNK